MTRRTALLLAATFLALAGVVGYQTHLVREQADTITALRQRVAQLASASASLRRQSETTARELGEAERQLTSLASPASSVAPERRQQMQLWLVRVKQLRRLFDERTDQRIPELRLLSDQDWLRVARHQDLANDEGVRRALAGIREAAISLFMRQITDGLRKFVKAPDLAPPVTIHALLPFLGPSVDASFLSRYELTSISAANLGGRAAWQVSNLAPIDVAYDSRFSLTASDAGSYGTSITHGPSAWILDYQGRFSRALKDSTAANGGQPHTDLAKVLSFFQPPLPPATVEKLLQSERARLR